MRINDDERRLWVLNDERLYLAMRADHPGKNDGEYDVRKWIADNRKMIDETIAMTNDK
jgi:hypothetical protein